MNAILHKISSATLILASMVTFAASTTQAEETSKRVGQFCSAFFRSWGSAKSSTPSISEDLKFRHYPPETNAKRRPRFYNEDLREISAPQLNDFHWPAGLRLRRIYQANSGSYSKGPKNFQIVVGDNELDLGHVSFFYDPERSHLSIDTMETVPAFQKKGLGTALLKSVDAFTMGKATTLHFSIDHANADVFLIAFKAGASVEEAVATTHIGSVVQTLGFRLKSTVPSTEMLRLRPQLGTVRDSDQTKPADRPYFLFDR